MKCIAIGLYVPEVQQRLEERFRGTIVPPSVGGQVRFTRQTGEFEFLSRQFQVAGRDLARRDSACARGLEEGATYVHAIRLDDGGDGWTTVANEGHGALSMSNRDGCRALETMGYALQFKRAGQR